MSRKNRSSQKKEEIVNQKQSFTSEVSVIIPFQNNEDHIRQAVGSVVCQTLSEIQILCLDKGSSDNSKNVIKSFFGEDHRVQILSATTQKKLGSHITGKYVLVLNPNDYLEPTALEWLYKKATAGDGEIVFSSFVNYDNQEMKDVAANGAFQIEKIPPAHVFSAYDCDGYLFDLVPMVQGCYLYKRDCFDRVFLSSSTDLLNLSPLFKALALSSKIVYVNFNLLHHRIKIDSTKADLVNEFKEVQAFLNESHNNQFRDSFIRCFLNLFWQQRNELKEPERSKFDLKIIKEVFPSFSDCLTSFYRYPIYSLLSKGNLSHGFDKMLDSNLDKIIPIVIPARWNIEGYNATVTIQSIIDKASDGYFYDIYILHMNNLESNTIIQLENLSRRLVRVTCVNIETYLPKGGFTSKVKDVFDCHLFLLSDIFSKYPKVLYLRPQMIVQKDIAEMFKINMSGAVIAGTMSYEDINYVEQNLGLIYEKFISNQVLLVDLDMWRQENLTQRCLDLVLVPLRKYKSLIRDILNYACADKIFVLPDGYNGRRALILGKKVIKDYPTSPECFSIINYSVEKPWINPELELMDIWWSIARKSPFYETILLRNISDRIKAAQPVVSKPALTSSVKPVQKTAPESVPKIVTKQQVLKHADNDSLYPLVKSYVKEGLWMCVTFGQSRRKHKEALQKIAQEISKKMNSLV